jgi:hypothetical protein
MVVVVIDKHPKQKRGFSRFHRPAELCLNGEWKDANGLYIEQNDPAALWACPCLDNRVAWDRAGRAVSKQADHADRRIHLWNRRAGRRRAGQSVRRQFR